MGVETVAQTIQRACDLLARARRVAVLTGAGVSAESGVPTFRSAGGLWAEHRVEDVATPRAFQRDPRRVWAFYQARLQNLRHVQPNAGHYALARLEARYESFTVVTQNVDGLHRRAGSRRVLEVHGSLAQVRCTGCESVFDQEDLTLEALPTCPRCGALLRPNVVWFEEALPEDVWLEACAAVDACEVLLVVGTSAAVYPVAGLIWQARQRGAKVIEINPEPTDATELADVSIRGRSGQVLPQIVTELESRRSA